MMKKTYFILVVLCGCLFLTTAHVHSQSVGINTENPSVLTALDVENIINGTDTIPKGIMIPRMSTSLRDRIDVSVATESNSLLIYNTDEDCYNYFSRLVGEWQSVCGKLGKAQFEISDCMLTKVYGQYQNKESLGSSHYIRITVKVTKAGSYTVNAIMNPDNGYYFSTSGEFLTTGTFELILQGAGTPINFTPSGQAGDLVEFTLNGITSNCTAYVKVEDSSIKPLYSMDCSTVTVRGVYRLNTALDVSNFITLQLNVDPAATGATYIIQTNTVDGITFSGSGILVGGTQTVTLQGSGKPTSLVNKVLTITTNSVSDVSSCFATVIVAYTKKKILSIGTYSISSYGYNFGGSGTNSNKLLTTPANFGLLETSKVKVEGISFINSGDFSPSTAQLTTALNQKPDVVIMGVWWNPDATQSQLLVDYVSKGGVLIAFMEETGTTTILQTIFNTAVTASPINAAGAVYQLPYVNDEVLNGPFGDIRGKQWGEDASQTRAISNIPTSQVIVYSTGRNLSGATSTGGDNMVTAFMHNTLNIVFACDGGFNSGSNNAPTSATSCPFNIDASNFPIPKSGYGDGGITKLFSVYNSVFTANALAWAFRRAQFYGINSVNK